MRVGSVVRNIWKRINGSNTAYIGTVDGFNAEFNNALIMNRTGGNCAFSARTYRSNTISRNAFTFNRYYGTESSPSAVVSGTDIFLINCNAYDGTNLKTVANMVGECDTYTGTDNLSGSISFGTRDDGAAASITTKLKIGKDGTYIGDGGTTDYVKYSITGDQTFVGSAGFYPRRITQSAIPASGTGDTQIDVGELMVWEDSDDGKVYLVYNDTTSGVKSVEMV